MICFYWQYITLDFWSGTTDIAMLRTKRRCVLHFFLFVEGMRRVLRVVNIKLSVIQSYPPKSFQQAEPDQKFLQYLTQKEKKGICYENLRWKYTCRLVALLILLE
jgi:hypothetical protein